MPAGFDKGDLIDDAYEVIERIGEGGFGDVYRVRQLSMSRDVALKILLQKGEESEHLAGRFRREVLAVRNLSHPNTVRIFDFSETPEGYLYYTMEYLRGKTLTERIRESEGVPPEEARDVLVQVLKSLSEAHSRGIVHRDLKPGNVMLADVHGETNFVKVLDFGIAKAAHTGSDDLPEDQLTSSENIVGTLRYMAPEQAKDTPIGPYTDLYTLGLVGLELVSGQKVFGGLSNVQILKEQLSPEPISLPEPLESSPMGETLQRALEKDIDERFESADEMRQELEALSKEELELSVSSRAAIAPESSPLVEAEHSTESAEPAPESGEVEDPPLGDTQPVPEHQAEEDGPPPMPLASDDDEGMKPSDEMPDSEELETIPPETGPEDAPSESQATEKVDENELKKLRENIAAEDAPEQVPVPEGESASAASESAPIGRVSTGDSTTEDKVKPDGFADDDLKSVVTSATFTRGGWSGGKIVVAAGIVGLLIGGAYFMMTSGGGASESSAQVAGNSDAGVAVTSGEDEDSVGMVFGNSDAGATQVRVTTPAGEAEVFHEGKSLGSTPIDVDVDGDMELELRSGEENKTIQLSANSPAVREVALGPGQNGDAGVVADGADKGAAEERLAKEAEEGGGSGNESSSRRTGGSEPSKERGRKPDPAPQPRRRPDPKPDPEPTQPAPEPTSSSSEKEESSDESDDEEEENEVPVFE